MRRAGAGLLAALGLALAPSTAAATWSIVAVDPVTRQVGVAVASCVEAPYGTTLLPYVAGLAPGRGALAAQALYDAQRRDEALAELLRGASPEAVIDAALAGDPQAATRRCGGAAARGLRRAAPDPPTRWLALPREHHRHAEPDEHPPTHRPHDPRRHTARTRLRLSLHRRPRVASATARGAPAPGAAPAPPRVPTPIRGRGEARPTGRSGSPP